VDDALVGALFLAVSLLAADESVEGGWDLPLTREPLLELAPELVLPGGGGRPLAAETVVERTSELEPLPELSARLRECVKQ